MICRVLYVLFTLNCIDFINCKPGDQPIEEDKPGQSDRDKQIEVIFDTNNIKEEDFIIYKGVEKERDHMFNEFQIVPRPGRSIVEIIIEESRIWKKLEGKLVESIRITKPGYVYSYYSVNLIDENKDKNSIHFMVPSMTSVDIGLPKYLQNIYRWTSNQGTIINKFNIQSTFDYNFYKQGTKQSPNGDLHIIKLEPTEVKYFDEIADGVNPLYKTNRVKAVELAAKNYNRCLAKFETIEGNFVYFHFTDKWNRINKNEYYKMFFENKFAECTEREEERAMRATTIFDIATAHKDMYMNKEVNLTVPTMGFLFTKIEELYDGDQLIIDKPLRNGKLMMYKGENSYEMIEVLSNNGPHYESHRKFLLDLINKRDVNSVRNLNKYFIKRNGTWEESSQLEFLDYFKAMVIWNLEKYNSQMEKITSDPKPETSTLGVNEINNNIKNNKEIIHFLKNLYLEGVKGMVETRLEDLLKSNIINDHRNKGEDPGKKDPNGMKEINEQEEGGEGSAQGSDYKSGGQVDPQKALKSRNTSESDEIYGVSDRVKMPKIRPVSYFYKKSVSEGVPTVPDKLVIEVNSPPGVETVERRRRKSIMGLSEETDEDSFYTSSLLLIPLILLLV